MHVQYCKMHTLDVGMCPVKGKFQIALRCSYLMEISPLTCGIVTFSVLLLKLSECVTF